MQGRLARRRAASAGAGRGTAPLPQGDGCALGRAVRAVRRAACRRRRGRRRAARRRRRSRFRRLGPPAELLDLALSRVELPDALLVELLAALPQLDRLVEACIPALQPLDDLLQLALGLLERHSTRAPKRPSATSTSIVSPAATASAERTIASPLRTIA